MVNAIRQRVTVQPGGVVQVHSAELTPGAQAEVIVLVEPAGRPAPPDDQYQRGYERAPEDPGRPLAGFIGAGKGCFSSTDEVDAFIRNERDAWER